jgi:ribosomal protein L24
MRKIKKGDNVVVIAGRDKGKRGDVTRVLADHVLVAGINQVKKHQRPNPMKGERSPRRPTASDCARSRTAARSASSSRTAS